MTNKHKNSHASGTDREGSFYKWWDWISRLTGPAGFLIALLAFWLNFQTAQVTDRLEVNQLLNEAFDLMAGKEGNPLTGMTFLRLDSHFERRNLELAFRNINDALEIDSDNSLAISYMGRYLFNLGKIDESINEQRRAIELEPDVPGAYIWLGLALEEKGDLDEALKSYERALELDPNDIYALNNLGLLYFRKQKVSDAIEVYRKAIAIDPYFGPARINLGLAMASIGELGEAVRLFKETIDRNPADCTAHSFLAKTLLILGKNTEAEHSKARAITLGCKEDQ